MENKCFTCGQPAEFSIMLGGDEERFYLPNQHVRRTAIEYVKEYWFCHPCMRMIEDNLRATIQYLKSDHGQKFRNL